MRYIVGKDTTIGHDTEIGNLVVIHDHAYIGHGVKIGEQTTIGAYSKIANHCSIGRTAYLGPSTMLEMYAIVEEFCYLERDILVCQDAVVQSHASIGAASVIGDTARIGRHARLGAQVVIGEGVSIHQYAIIGDDCEIRSSIGRCLSIPSGCVIPEGYEPIVDIAPIGVDLDGWPFVLVKTSDGKVLGTYRQNVFDRYTDAMDHLFTTDEVCDPEAAKFFVHQMVELCRAYSGNGRFKPFSWASDWLRSSLAREICNR